MKKAIKNLILLLGFVSFIFLLFLNTAIAKQDDPADDAEYTPDTEEFPFAEENENCLKCHGEQYFTLTDPVFGTEKKRMMAEHYLISRQDYYNANHRTFACLDCHAYEYEEFPHPIEARMEEPYACIDCHGYDENWAHFRFEEIEEEYMNSVHAGIEGFSCWKCHDAHSYRINIRNTENISQTIVYDNAICLECHGNVDNFMLLTDREEIDIVNKHDWLPNQAAHFGSVRCIECHTALSDSLLVAHDLRPSEEAVRKCTECHSSDSRLMHTLYKFESKERRKSGFVNGVILNETFVIGANRNIYLNYGSIVIFGLVLVVIGVHVVFRIVKK